MFIRFLVCIFISISILVLNIFNLKILSFFLYNLALFLKLVVDLNCLGVRHWRWHILGAAFGRLPWLLFRGRLLFLLRLWRERLPDSNLLHFVWFLELWIVLRLGVWGFWLEHCFIEIVVLCMVCFYWLRFWHFRERFACRHAWARHTGWEVRPDERLC